MTISSQLSKLLWRWATLPSKYIAICWQQALDVPEILLLWQLITLVPQKSSLDSSWWYNGISKVSYLCSFYYHVFHEYVLSHVRLSLQWVVCQVCCKWHPVCGKSHDCLAFTALEREAGNDCVNDLSHLIPQQGQWLWTVATVRCSIVRPRTSSTPHWKPPQIIEASLTLQWQTFLIGSGRWMMFWDQTSPGSDLIMIAWLVIWNAFTDKYEKVVSIVDSLL